MMNKECDNIEARSPGRYTHFLKKDKYTAFNKYNLRSVPLVTVIDYGIPLDF
jgi:hypothetical protein